jgi:hypothetical protein
LAKVSIIVLSLKFGRRFCMLNSNVLRKNGEMYSIETKNGVKL